MSPLVHDRLLRRGHVSPQSRQVRSRARLAVSCRSASANTAGRPSGSSDNAGPAKHPRAEAESSTSYSWTEDSWAALGMRLALERIYRLNETETGRQQQRLPAAPGLESLEVGSFAVMAPETPPKPNNNDHDYYANVGDAIRTLREEVPLLFVKDLTYDIYREDIVFRDPRNTFKGMKNYKTIFWSLRFHGSIFFKSLYVDVRRIWQPEPNIIQMRWTVHGIPRVPWEAEGTFDGISTYRLDKAGKIYEHSVDNVLLRDPPTSTPLFARLNLVPTLQPSQQPYPGMCRGGGGGGGGAASAAASIAASDAAVVAAHGSATSAASATGGEGSNRLRDYATRFSWVRFYFALSVTMQTTRLQATAGRARSTVARGLGSLAAGPATADAPPAGA